MQPTLPIAQLIEELSKFATAVAAIDPPSKEDWNWRPNPEDWSLAEVMCHLRDVEMEVHTVRYRAVINQDNPFLPGAATDEWAEIRCYNVQDGPDAREIFLTARRQNIALLSNLAPEMWQREGRHAFFGPTTLQELVNLAVQHDEVHLQQIHDVLGE